MRTTYAAAAAAVFATQVIAHPLESHGKLSRRTVDLNQFRLNTVPKYVNSGEVVSTVNIKPQGYLDTAKSLVKSTLPDLEFRLVEDHYTGTNGISHVHFKQTAHGLDIDNADFNVNVAKDGSVLSYGHSFYKGAIPAASPLTKRDFLDPVAALKGASKALDLGVKADGATATATEDTETFMIENTVGAYQTPLAKLVYFVTGEDKDNILLSWRVETDLYDDWLLSYVDAVSGEKVQAVVNYKADATYEVFPWGVNDPDSGSRKFVTDPWDETASPSTWQNDGKATYTSTRGNNGIAQANFDGDSAFLNDFRPDAGKNSSFVYDLDLTATNPKTNINASITQLWYTANMYHDLLYDLGFTEAAGNFEVDNDGKGGVGGDAIILNAQDGAGTDNADFSTPPDGQPGRMRMFLWTETTPKRDCTFEAGVVIHEYTHGLSNRLTGGPKNSACLNTLEAGGMGEGWGDFFATAIRSKTTDTRKTDYALGAWVFGNTAGLRDFLYSTSLTTNPLTYLSLNTLNEVHAIGTFWATVLYELLWNLIDEHGNTSDDRPTYDSNGVPTDGKFLTMRLVVDAMALQPCNPNAVQARDAIIDADEALTGGANACLIWTAFAKRGLGSKAKFSSSKRVADTTIPTGIC